SLVSTGHDNHTSALSSDEITIRITVGGEEKSITVAAGDTSLEGIRAAINKADIGITATIINNGGASADDSPSTGTHQLVFSTKETGSAASITKIVVEGSTPIPPEENGPPSVDLAELLSYDAQAETP